MEDNRGVTMIVSCAIRGRSDGEWYTTEHRQKLEIGSGVAYSITSVSKDSLILIVNEKD